MPTIAILMNSIVMGRLQFWMGWIMATDGEYPNKILAWLQPATGQPLSRRFLPLWLALRSELAPIVGDSGFSALFARCLSIRGDLFPWLSPPPAAAGLLKMDFGELAVKLAITLEEQAPDVGLAASRALFATFYDLLLVLVGERLLAGVLDAVWKRPGFRESAGRLAT
ncbi:hypothetical protein LJR289_001761 [Pseudoduganella sp. LjRoot289]|uniref:hypothetical protein n=1 Tax=Pseudoduganella sp. LjRoot289 TaxID=3342314 RepID=UPI003ECD4E99